MAFAVAGGDRAGADPARPGDRLRQDGRAQPGAARRASTSWSTLGRPVVIGTSRKSFLGRLTGRDGPDDRLAATIATNVLAYERGARVFRVHDVAPVRDALAVTAATVSAPWTSTPDEFDEVEEDDEEEGHPEPEVTIEISGLSLFTHVGVTAAEREVGQRLLLDLRLDVGECDATVTDRHRGHRRLRARCASWPTSSPSSAPTRRSSGCARRSPTGCSSSYDAQRGVGQGGQARAADARCR